MGLHCVPESEGKVGGKEREGWSHLCSNSVCGPAAMDSRHCQHQAGKQCKYRCCTYPKILNHASYRVAPFPLLSCFIMKTETNCGFRSSVLFWFFFLSTPPPATVELNQEPWQRCCRCNCAAPHVTGDALAQGGAIHTRVH